MDFNLKKGDTIYFLGIAGTGMAAVAGLFKEAGYHVVGSDGAIYPPMSTMLQEQGIEVFTPYSEENIKKNPAALYVIANALSRSHPELEYVLQQKLPYTSFPALLGSTVLKEKISLVVCGTHGKTTTTSLLTHILQELHHQPSFIVGGIPLNFKQSFSMQEGPFFVIEGDEYDTCFFDKKSKFLHYNPRYIIANNLEYDHADIFPDYASLERMFEEFFALAPSPHNIIANTSDKGLNQLLSRKKWDKEVYATQTQLAVKTQKAPLQLLKSQAKISGPFMWESTLYTDVWGEFSFRFRLPGHYNMANVIQALGCISALVRDKLIPNPTKKLSLPL
jgi:UDP-N-acetylmuramate: L-alanyl-gamma-D-glutamyl-meso-diaminopimelate ligase